VIVQDVIDELGDALDEIEGLRVFRYLPDSVSPPVAIVALPERIDFDETYGRGSDRLTIDIAIIVDKAYDRTVVGRMSPFASGSGESAVKNALETYDSYTAFDWVHVDYAEFVPHEHAGQSFLSCVFTVQVVGVGDAEANPRPITPGGPPVVVTDLSFGEHTATTIELLSSTGDDVVLPSATPTLAGLLSAADKARLDTLPGTVGVYAADPLIPNLQAGDVWINTDTGDLKFFDGTAINTVDKTKNEEQWTSSNW